jgi:diguanylate cyclase (GGDEF)-like protein/PAS domain S-box-containing protein
MHSNSQNITFRRGIIYNVGKGNTRGMKLEKESNYNNKKILIVEDSRLISIVVAGLLHKNGYKTETAVSGEEAIQKACTSYPPDLILMDIELEGKIDGIEAARKILKFRDIPVIFLTANTSREIFNEIKAVNGYGYVLKGTDKYVLLSSIEMALKLHEANKHAKMCEQLFESSLNEFFIFHPETLKFIVVNHSARENLGYTMAELNTMTPIDIKPDIDPEGYRRLILPLLKKERDQVVFNTVHRRKDGCLYPVEVHTHLFNYRGKQLCLELNINLTERLAMEEGLRERETILSTITGSASDAIVMLDGQGNVSFWNPAAEKIFGYPREAILGKNLHRMVVPDEHLYEIHKRAFKHFQSTGQGNVIGKTIELKAKHQNGRNFDAELSLTALWLKDSWHTVGIVRDISKRKQAEEELRRLSVTDTLTSIYNRRYFVQVLENEIERAKRTVYEFSLIMLDIDRFKSINDQYGHNSGDLVLKSMAKMISNRIRKIDVFARWGGEEFVILLPDTSVKQAVNLAEELREHISRMDIPSVCQVTASFGVAGYCPEDTVDTLVNKADNAMYEAKDAGRNRVHYVIS